MQRHLQVALAWALLAAAPARAEEALVDGVAAQVGSDIVLVSDVMQISQAIVDQMKAAGAPESEIAKARASAQEELIDRLLLERVVKQSELAATDAEVDEAIEGIARENGLSLEQLKASVTSHDLSYPDYRTQIKRELERRKVVQTLIATKVRVEEDDLKRLYAERYADQPAGGETVHVRQIIVPFGPEMGRDQAIACRIARDAEQRIREGAAFEDVAREASAVAPMEGGDIGWLHADSMAAWMKQALAPLKPGDMTGVIELPFGCIVMQLIDRREWIPMTFEAAKPKLEEQVYEAKLAEEYRAWMDKLREHSFIERRGYFADAAKLGSSALAQDGEEGNSAEGSGSP